MKEDKLMKIFGKVFLKKGILPSDVILHIKLVPPNLRLVEVDTDDDGNFILIFEKEEV